MNGDRSYTGAAGKISDHCFLKKDTEGDKIRRAGSLFQNFTIRTEKAPLLHRRSARGGRRKNSDRLKSTSALKILKARMRSARRRLRSSEKRLSWRSLSSYGT